MTKHAPKRQAESGIKRTVREFLEWHKWEVVQFQEGPFGEPGVSDLLAIRRGRHLFLEIKTTTGNQSPNQKEFAAKINRGGGEYYIIRDVDDLERVGRIL